MKILIILCDMLRANLQRTFNNDIRNNSPFDEFLKDFGGTAYVNCYTIAPDSPRSYASLYTSRYPKDNGCDHRIKWPGEYLNPDILNVFNYLKDHGFYFTGYTDSDMVAKSALPSDFIEGKFRTGSFKDYTNVLKREISLHENIFSYILLEWLHKALSDYGAFPSTERWAQKALIGQLNSLFGLIEKDDFDAIFLLSDHGMQLSLEKFKRPKELFIDDARSKVLMVLRQRNDKGLRIRKEIRTLLDVFPTIIELVEDGEIGKPEKQYEMEGRSLLSHKNGIAIIEDHIGTYGMEDSFPELWGVRAEEWFYIRSAANWILMEHDKSKITSSYKIIERGSDQSKSHQKLIEKFDNLILSKTNMGSILEKIALGELTGSDHESKINIIKIIMTYVKKYISNIIIRFKSLIQLI